MRTARWAVLLRRLLALLLLLLIQWLMLRLRGAAGLEACDLSLDLELVVLRLHGCGDIKLVPGSCAGAPGTPIVIVAAFLPPKAAWLAPAGRRA